MAGAAGDIFDPADWLVVHDGHAVARKDLAPCRGRDGSCGETVFEVWVQSVSGVVRVVCPRCVRRKPGDRPVARVDMERQEVLPASDARDDG